MFDFALAQQNAPFAVAIGLMLLIALFEGVGALFATGISDLLDGLIPDFEAQVEIELSEVGTTNALSRLLGWLKVGKVPLLMLLVVFLTAFGLIGYTIQFFTSELFGLLWPAVLASIPAFAGSLPVVRVAAKVLERILPGDETTAVSTDSLVGRIATITLGTAQADRAAEARVTDRYETSHYVRVIPEKDHPPMTQGTQVLLVRQEGPHFIAIENTDPILNR